MKFKERTPPLVHVEFVRDDNFSKQQLGAEPGMQYVFDPRMPYGFQYNGGEVGPQYLPYRMYTKFKHCFKILGWIDYRGESCSYEQAIESMIMVMRKQLSSLYHELSVVRNPNKKGG